MLIIIRSTFTFLFLQFLFKFLFKNSRSISSSAPCFRPISILLYVFWNSFFVQFFRVNRCLSCSLLSLILSSAPVKLICNCPKDALRTDNSRLFMASSFCLASGSLFFTSSFVSMLFIASKSTMYSFYESLITSSRDLVMRMSIIECCKIASFTNLNASIGDSPRVSMNMKNCFY